MFRTVFIGLLIPFIGTAAGSIAHRMRTIEAADRIIVLENGRVAEEGSPEELLAKEDGIFRHMRQLQSAGADWSI